MTALQLPKEGLLLLASRPTVQSLLLLVNGGTPRIQSLVVPLLLKLMVHVDPETLQSPLSKDEGEDSTPPTSTTIPTPTPTITTSNTSNSNAVYFLLLCIAKALQLQLRDRSSKSNLETTMDQIDPNWLKGTRRLSFLF